MMEEGARKVLCDVVDGYVNGNYQHVVILGHSLTCLDLAAAFFASEFKAQCRPLLHLDVDRLAATAHSDVELTASTGALLSEGEPAVLMITSLMTRLTMRRIIDALFKIGQRVTAMSELLERFAGIIVIVNTDGCEQSVKGFLSEWAAACSAAGAPQRVVSLHGFSSAPAALPENQDLLDALCGAEHSRIRARRFYSTVTSSLWLVLSSQHRALHNHQQQLVEAQTQYLCVPSPEVCVYRPVLAHTHPPSRHPPEVFAMTLRIPPSDVMYWRTQQVLDLNFSGCYCMLPSSAAHIDYVLRVAPAFPVGNSGSLMRSTVQNALEGLGWVIQSLTHEEFLSAHPPVLPTITLSVGSRVMSYQHGLGKVTGFQLVENFLPGLHNKKWPLVRYDGQDDAVLVLPDQKQFLNSVTGVSGEAYALPLQRACAVTPHQLLGAESRISAPSPRLEPALLRPGMFTHAPSLLRLVLSKTKRQLLLHEMASMSLLAANLKILSSGW